MLTKSTFTIVVLCFLALWISTTEARPEFLKRIPNGHKVVHVCNKAPVRMVGHDMTGSFGKLNSFGRDFKKANFKWTKSLCKKDSDKDGLTNGEELGDPHCLWPKVKSTAKNITHPGMSNKCK